MACHRSLGDRGVRTIGAGERPDAPGLASKYCDETVSVPDPSVDLAAYADSLLSLARREDVRTIVPVREADVYVLAKHGEAFAEHVGTPWPTLDALRNVQDRVRLFDIAADAGVAAPETTTVSEWDDWSRDVIVKPRYTIHASEYLDGVAHSHTQSHSTQYIAPDADPDREALLAEMGHEPLVQAYVPDSDEYGFFALYDEGDAVATFQHRQRRGYKYCGGPSAYRESVAIPDLEAAGRRLLDELEWHGVAMVEFLRDPDTDQFQLMEINPRFWTSLPFTVRAGVDFPYYVWQQSRGERPPTDPEYEVGVAGHLLRGELLHLHSILREDYPLVERPSFARSAAAIAASLVRHPRFDCLDLDDPRPFLREVRNTLRAMNDRRPERADDSRTSRAAVIETLRARLS